MVFKRTPFEEEVTWFLCRGHTLSSLYRLHDNSFLLSTLKEEKSVNIAPWQHPSMVGWSLRWPTPSGAHRGRAERGCQHTTPRGKVNPPLPCLLAPSHTAVLGHFWSGYNALLVTQLLSWCAKDEAFPVQSFMEERQALPYSVQRQMAPLHSRKVMHFTIEILQTEGSETVVDSPVRNINTIIVECKLFLW